MKQLSAEMTRIVVHKPFSPTQTIPTKRWVSWEIYEREIRNWLERKQIEAWKSTSALNHSKQFIKAPKKEKAREILLYERKTLKSIVEMITGHCRLRKHLHTLGKVFEPDCKKCGME